MTDTLTIFVVAHCLSGGGLIAIGLTLRQPRVLAVGVALLVIGVVA